MTEAELKKICDRAAAAVKDPWIFVKADEHDCGRIVGGALEELVCHFGEANGQDDNIPGEAPNEPTMAFILKARDDVWLLLQEVDRLRELVKSTEDYRIGDIKQAELDGAKEYASIYDKPL